jgi:hypothetical protein
MGLVVWSYSMGFFIGMMLMYGLGSWYVAISILARTNRNAA